MTMYWLKHVEEYFYNIINFLVSMVINNNSLIQSGEGTNFLNVTILVTRNKIGNIRKT